MKKNIKSKTLRFSILYLLTIASSAKYPLYGIELYDQNERIYNTKDQINNFNYGQFSHSSTPEATSLDPNDNTPHAYPFEDDSSYSIIASPGSSPKTYPYFLPSIKENEAKTIQETAKNSVADQNGNIRWIQSASSPEKDLIAQTDAPTNNPIFNTLPGTSIPNQNINATIKPLETPPVIGNSNISNSTPLPPPQPAPTINFNNVSIIEYIRFISRISNKNFVFEDADLQFNVTIVSEEPTSISNLMSALLQELRIRNLSLMEQGNNIIIHRNPRIRAPARIVSGNNEEINSQLSELVTRVFRLNTLDPLKASEIIRPLLSDDALVEVLRDTNNLIITDLVTNVNKITQLIANLDAPNSGVTIGQYVVKNAFVDSLAELSSKIIQPIAQGNPFILVPHSGSNSIYIVSNGFIVEKALAILQNLDLNEGKTKIFSLESLYPSNLEATPVAPEVKNFFVAPSGYTIDSEGYLIDSDGKRLRQGAPGTEGFPADSEGFLRGMQNRSQETPNTGQRLLYAPEGYTVGPDGYILSATGQNVRPGTPGTSGYPVGPDGNLLAREGIAFSGIKSESAAPKLVNPFSTGQIGTSGVSGSILGDGRDLLPGGIGSSSRWSQELPTGHIERTLFSIYKLRYRRGDQIEIALRKIALSLQQTGTSNIDLLEAINSVQWIESSNSLILTGTPTAIDRIRGLINEIDTPIRQVFIEMLILATTIEDSLQYGVQLNQYSGGVGANTLTNQGFNGNIGAEAANSIDYTTNPPTFGDISSVFGNLGYTAAVIGTHLTHCGTRFNTISALVKALHQNSKTRIVLNPKIVTEDNTTATIFVGTTDRYKTQSITNDLGNLVTNNFQFIDVGTTLQVTPIIGSNGLITLDIVQETSNGSDTANTSPGGSNNTASTDVNLVPVISTSRTNTRVHIPDGFFIILSGMIQDVESRVENRIPCLGGIPIIGGACKQKGNEDRKQNLMIFIRPLIVDTESELEDITRRQQDVFREKSKFRRPWNYEVDEALDQFNIKPTDPDVIGCFET